MAAPGAGPEVAVTAAPEAGQGAAAMTTEVVSSETAAAGPEKTAEGRATAEEVQALARGSARGSAQALAR